MNANGQCPLCGRVPDHFGRDSSRPDVYNVECERCGRFKISHQATLVLTDEQKWKLSAVCRRAGRGSNYVEILSSNVEELVDSVPKYSPPEKLDNLLQLMGEMSPDLVKDTTFDTDRDYPLLFSTPDEVNFLYRTLSDRGYFERSDTGVGLSMVGWEHLETIKRQGRSSSRAFVAMWFDEGTKQIYESAIHPAIIEAGYEPLRIDQHEHVNRIDDEIIGQIRRSRYMVADFTGQRPGVYFEAGLMLGLGRQVIWMCSNQELTREGGLHFDVRQFNFIAYESAAEAKKRLYDRILAIEGEGPVRRRTV